MNPLFDYITVVEYNSADYRATLSLRDQILRKPLNLEFKPEELAKEKQDIHIAYFSHEEIIACLVLKKLNNDIIQMRQVAVKEDKQNFGIGSALVTFAEEFASEKGYSTMICHARDIAVPFYLKHGYKKVGEAFIEVGILHYKMEKPLI